MFVNDDYFNKWMEKLYGRICDIFKVINASAGANEVFGENEKIYYKTSDVRAFVYKNGDHWDKKAFEDTTNKGWGIMLYLHNKAKTPKKIVIPKINITFVANMKRTISFILLIGLLLTAVQPSIAFHYCKGELHSVGFVKKDLPKSCCKKNGPNCCSNKILKVKTDSFPIHQTDTDIQTPAFLHPLFFVMSGDLIFPCENGLLLQQVFPPGGLARYSAEMRHLICIYRI